jgi:hypothetical protein
LVTSDERFLIAAVGNGDILVLDLSAPHVTKLSTVSDIKLLNIFLVNEKIENKQTTSVDILTANGRLELIKSTLQIKEG